MNWKPLLYLFKEFRFARRLIGGEWYKVEDNKCAAGFGGPIVYWTDKTPLIDVEIIKHETLNRQPPRKHIR